MGDTLMISAEVAGSPVRAILDSGSAASIINTRLVKRLGIASSGKRIIHGAGGRVEVTEISDVALTVADDRRRLTFAIVSDLAAISSAFGRPIDLVLGEDILDGLVSPSTSRGIGLASRRRGVLPVGAAGVASL